MKELIDGQASSTETEYKDLLAKYRRSHTQYKSETKNTLKLVDMLLAESTEAIKSGSNHLLIDLAKDVASRNFLISKYMNTKPEIPNFILEYDPRIHIQAAFGFVDKGKVFEHAHTQVIKGAIPKFDRKYGARTEIGAKITAPGRMLMTRAEVNMKKKELQNIPRMIARTKDGRLIMCYGFGDSTISILYPNSTTVNAVKCDACISNVAIDQSTDQLYCIHLGSQEVRSLTMRPLRSLTREGETCTLFKIEESPWTLAVTQHSSNVIIGQDYAPKIHIYNRSGLRL